MRLAFGQTQDVGPGCFTGALAFIYFGGTRVEDPAAERQKFPPPGEFDASTIKDSPMGGILTH